MFLGGCLVSLSHIRQKRLLLLFTLLNKNQACLLNKNQACLLLSDLCFIKNTVVLKIVSFIYSPSQLNLL